MRSSEALDAHEVHYVVVGGFARVVHGTAELTRDLDIAPALVDFNVRAIDCAIAALDAVGESRHPCFPACGTERVDRGVRVR